MERGIKLIYHESPSRASPNDANWIQSTVKLFIRPGDCHGTRLKQPNLAWAVLPAVSRMKLVGSFDEGEKSLWTNVGLLDVISILVDEGENNANPNAAPSPSFFSITATDGTVYVFEAPSAKQRDYVVKGLRSVVARMNYQILAGDANVIGELYSEDAGVSTGELPNLATPWKALDRVTRAFLDQQ